MAIHKVSEYGTYPKNKTYVLIHYTGGNWLDYNDQLGNEFKIVKYIDNKFIYENLTGRFSIDKKDLDYWFDLPKEKLKEVYKRIEDEKRDSEENELQRVLKKIERLEEKNNG